MPQACIVLTQCCLVCLNNHFLVCCMPLVDFQIHSLWTHSSQASSLTISLKLLVVVISEFHIAQSSGSFLVSLALSISSVRYNWLHSPPLKSLTSKITLSLGCSISLDTLIFVDFFHLVLLILIAYNTCSALGILSLLRTLFLLLPSQVMPFPFFLLRTLIPLDMKIGTLFISPFQRWNHSPLFPKIL